MQKGEIGCGELFPSNQDATEAVHPTVRAFNNPASRTETCLSFNTPRLLATRVQMEGKAELGDRFTHFGIAVTLIEAEALWMRGSRLGALQHER